MDLDIEVVWYLSFSLLMQMSHIFFPLTILIEPILKLIIFLFYYLMLVGYVKDEEVSSTDESTSVYISSISLITYSLYVFMVIMFSVFSYEPNKNMRTGGNCGPLDEE